MAREPATSSAQRAKSSMTLCCSLPLLARLSRELPDAVNKYTPQGRLPTEA